MSLDNDTKAALDALVTIFETQCNSLLAALAEYRATYLNGTTPTPIPPLDLSAYGTLADEKACYVKWGWAWTPSQEPSIPTGIHPIGHINVHSDLEADDLWQNIVMYQRVAQSGYHDLATSWAAYYKNTYLSDYVTYDRDSFFGDHTFGWGLLCGGTIDGDTTFTAAANAIGDSLESQWYGFGVSVKAGFYGLRGPGRILKLAVALGRRTWADAIWAALRDSFVWSDRGTYGFWWEDASAFPWAVGATGAISTFEFAVLHDGLSDYFAVSGDVEVRRRLVLMSRFAELYGMDPTVNQTGHWIMVDFPGPEAYFHTGVGPGEPLDPFYTCTFVNVLTRGYQLTNDLALLDRAKYHWDRSSKAVPGDTYPYLARTPDNEVGHFMNSQMESGGIYYASNGELPYVGLLFKVAADATDPLPPVDGGWVAVPNSSLRQTMIATGYIVSPGPDGNGHPMDNIIKDWNGGSVDTSRQRMILPACGGHNSWFFNDVWAFDIPTLSWINLRQSYLPYITLAQADAGDLLVYPDGSPSTVHTYDGVAHLAGQDAIYMIGGPGWNNTGRGPGARKFMLGTGQWVYDPTQPIYPSRASTAADTDGNVWIRTESDLHVRWANGSYQHSMTLPSVWYMTMRWLDESLYEFGYGGVRKITPWVDYTDLVLAGDAFPNVPAPGVDWFPEISRFVLWGGGLDVYLIDPIGLTCTKSTLTGDDPGPAQGLGTYKRFGRFATKQAVLVNSIDAVHLVTLD